MQANGEVRLLTGLVKQSFSAFISIFNALLFLKGERVPDRKEEVIRAMDEHYGLDRNLFQDLLNIKTGEKKVGKNELNKTVWRYISEIKELSKKVDKISI